jgi:uncharacterized protein (UPF0332 family)
MDKINWCIKQKNGLELKETNSNLSDEYINKAKISLKTMRDIEDREWKIITTYYTFYSALYAILIKIGIKCEIHNCTLEFTKKYLYNYFEEEEIDFLKKVFQARINAQYYINKNVPDETYKEMKKRAPLFLIKCKEILSKITETEINNIRDKLKNDNML